MKFAFSDDVLAVRDSLRNALKSGCPVEVVRQASTSEGDESVRALWRLLGDMGVLGLLVKEKDGGLGFDELFMVVVLEELGYVAAPGPLAETISMAAPLVGATENQEALLERILAGQALTACDLGQSSVPYAEVCDGVIVIRDDEVRYASREQIETEPVATVDATRRSGRVNVIDSSCALVSSDLPRALDRATLAAAAELVGLSARMLEMTRTYVLTREQFGVSIGSLQAVKHALADLLIAIEFARPAVWRAAVPMSRGGPQSSLHVSMAKALASDAALRAAKTSIQCHGAMGYTVEYDLQLFTKRAWARCTDMGDSQLHVSRIADWLGVAGSP